ncbi:TetR/AcrR family transcriptional regulator [Nocardiopsis sp. CNS-639]|uniref:TetR/AcrR family transcriptional regulator n=1 Tax=Nocardiopsis sp. CNS-639 TaxID=1169153 RepID=UPI0003809102|nr:TetR/AcrR family transcriptional regulator [Nocardiopsis sp. CNS-639]
MATPGTRGEYAKSARRREEIIRAAVEVFSESGFRDGSLRQVAERAGMTHAGMRHHFPTKSDLLEAVLQWREHQALERARRSHPVGLEVLRAWVDSVADSITRPALVELEAVLGAEAISPKNPAHDYFDDLYRRAVDLLEKSFSVAAAEGVLRDGIPPRTAARLVLSTTLGLQSLWLRDKSIDVAVELELQVRSMITTDLPPAMSEE